MLFNRVVGTEWEWAVLKPTLTGRLHLCPTVAGGRTQPIQTLNPETHLCPRFSNSSRGRQLAEVVHYLKAVNEFLLCTAMFTVQASVHFDWLRLQHQILANRRNEAGYGFCTERVWQRPALPNGPALVHCLQVTPLRWRKSRKPSWSDEPQ